jgi:S-adenosylmethionine decarboxylase
MYSNKGELLAVDFYLNTWIKWVEMEKVFINALSFSNMNVIDKLLHKFEPQGETCIWLLEESHMAVHTYPEKKYFAIDIFTCGAEGKPMDTISYLTKKLPVNKYFVNKVIRGVMK